MVFLDTDIVIPRIKINQPTTRIEGAKEGHFRNILSGEEFLELQDVIFLKRTNGRVLFKKDDFTGFRQCWSNDGLIPSDSVFDRAGEKPKCERCTTTTKTTKLVHCDFAVWHDSPPLCKETINFLGIDHEGVPFWISFHGAAIPIVKSFLGCLYLKKKKAASQGKNVHLRHFKISISLQRKVAKGKFYVPFFKKKEYIDATDERLFLDELFENLSQKNMEETIAAEEELTND